MQSELTNEYLGDYIVEEKIRELRREANERQLVKDANVAYGITEQPARLLRQSASALKTLGRKLAQRSNSSEQRKVGQKHSQAAQG